MGFEKSECPTVGIFENMIGFNPVLSSKLVTQTHLMTWLLKRIQAKSHDENRAYAAELLSILLQSQKENRLAICENDGIEIILKVLSVISISNQLHHHHVYCYSFFQKTAISKKRPFGHRGS